MIPRFNPFTGNLPPGIHEATWDEVAARFGYTPHRLILLAGLKEAFDSLRSAGCQRAYINGSFITSAETPGDFDACWEQAGVDPDVLDPVLLTFDDLRAAQKSKYRGELFIADAAADLFGMPFLKYFQRDKHTHDPKGIIAIDLRGLP